MTLDFVHSQDGQTIIEEKTDIACWWCTYNFDTIPCFVPEKFYNNKYHVFGCFCSYNCAASYCLGMTDSFTWNRYGLLKKLYNTVYGNTESITIAPPREAFRKFGGTLSYEDYRKNCVRGSKEYRFIMPPMTSIVPLIEEGNTDVTKVNISLAEINKKTMLRRTKPLPSVRNNLFETLGIKEKKSI
jgi:hypothetical protein